MSKKNEDEHIKALRDDPDFRALVEALRDQTPEQLEAFHDEFDGEDGPKHEKELDEND
ncbi:MAG: hypothetical protein HY912_16080 [Desulfomonile tiedjei]|uniref:Uncharacterized protein n=1 Tax=Desulfomonile tiedjei TaxID=2358 RepID=A0A9D6Z1F0_9BACT|nr:hypothetical protein [Desulfomonile tiedjei]